MLSKYLIQTCKEPKLFFKKHTLSNLSMWRFELNHVLTKKRQYNKEKQKHSLTVRSFTSALFTINKLRMKREDNCLDKTQGWFSYMVFLFKRSIQILPPLMGGIIPECLAGKHALWVLSLLLIILNIIITVTKAHKGFVFQFQEFYFKSFALHFSWWHFLICLKFIFLSFIFWEMS